MQHTHTPGPWTVRSEGPPFNDVCGPNGKIIATAFPPSRQYSFPLQAIAISEANAVLIAAAPDMLTALMEIAKGRGAYNPDQLQHAANCIDEMRAIAKAAIAKATGEPSADKYDYAADDFNFDAAREDRAFGRRR